MTFTSEAEAVEKLAGLWRVAHDHRGDPTSPTRNKRLINVQATDDEASAAESSPRKRQRNDDPKEKDDD